MKKMKPSERKVGIWLDHQKAFIMQWRREGRPLMEKILSEVEPKNSFQRTETVPEHLRHGMVKDKEKQQRRQHQEKLRFFRKIIETLHGADYIYLFGPGMAKDELINSIEEDPVLKHKALFAEPADKLTQNQMLERTILYFSGDEFKGMRSKWRKLHAIH